MDKKYHKSAENPEKHKQKHNNIFTTNIIFRSDKRNHIEDTSTYSRLSPSDSTSPSPDRVKTKINARKPTRLVSFSTYGKRILSKYKTGKDINDSSEYLCKCESDSSSSSEEYKIEEEDTYPHLERIEEFSNPGFNVSDSYANSSLRLKESKSEENLLCPFSKRIESKQDKEKEKKYSDLYSSKNQDKKNKTEASLRKNKKERSIPYEGKESLKHSYTEQKRKAESYINCALKHSKASPSSSSLNKSMAAVKSVFRISGEYDPHDFRVVDKPTNYFETLVHLVKCSLGTGILAMPQAFAISGFLVGIIFTIIIGIIITHCVSMLIRAQYILCKHNRVPYLTYADSMSAALNIGPSYFRKCSRVAGIIVNIFIIILQLGICCVYIVFIAGTIKQIVDPYYTMRIETHMVIILGPLLLANCIPNLKILAPFSLLANILILLSVCITIYFLLTGAKKTTESIDLWGSIFTFPLFFGTVLFSLLSIAVVVSLEGNMSKPKQFLSTMGVLNAGMVLIICLYVATGAIGYLFCKSQCSDSIVFDLPKNNPVTIAVLIMYALAMIISYVLQCYVPIEIIWNNCIHKKLEGASKAKQAFWNYFLRIAVCFFTLFFATAARRLGVIFTLMGGAILGIMVPALMEFCIISTCTFSLRKYMTIIKDIMLLCIAFIALVVFSITSM